jgi:Trypsin Inhibitor like cysteine rich domain
MHPIMIIALGCISLTVADEQPLIAPIPEIQPEKPQVTCGINEEYTCGSACDTECSTLGQHCNIYTYACVDMCRCKEGFARDYTNVCIPEKKCPGRTICPRGEVYDKRILSCPQQRTCASLLNRENTCGEDEVPTEIGGCRCRSGYIRSGIRDKCVRPEQCCTEPNTVFVHAPNPCQGNTCQQPEFTPCRQAGRVWGCQCKKGYVRKEQGSYGCIHLSKCNSYPSSV